MQADVGMIECWFRMSIYRTCIPNRFGPYLSKTLGGTAEIQIQFELKIIPTLVAQILCILISKSIGSMHNSRKMNQHIWSDLLPERVRDYAQNRYNRRKSAMRTISDLASVHEHHDYSWNIWIMEQQIITQRRANKNLLGPRKSRCALHGCLGTLIAFDHLDQDQMILDSKSPEQKPKSRHHLNLK